MTYKPSFALLYSVLLMAERRGASRGSVMKVDTSLDWERRLSYAEKGAVWDIFRYLYWGIYAFVVGCMLVIAGYTSPNPLVFAGWALIMLAVFLVIYGFVTSLHRRLMKRHG